MNLTDQEKRELQEAAKRLERNGDIKLVLTYYKKECMSEFEDTDATIEQLSEAHRRYHLADGIMHRINRYARDGS